MLAVRQHEGRMLWLDRSVGKPIAREAGQITLFIPHGVEGFVSRGAIDTAFVTHVVDAVLRGTLPST